MKCASSITRETFSWKLQKEPFNVGRYAQRPRRGLPHNDWANTINSRRLAESKFTFHFFLRSVRNPSRRGALELGGELRVRFQEREQNTIASTHERDRLWLWLNLKSKNGNFSLMTELMGERKEYFNPIKGELWKVWKFTSLLPASFSVVIISSFSFNS
jgi:hypothetical protein